MRIPLLIIATLTAGVLTMNATTSGAQTQSDVDEAKRRADYAEALKREADARKAAAEANAAAANAAQVSRAAAAKADADAEKARLDAQKAALPTAPDPSKYKIAAPTAPNVAGEAARLAYSDTDKLAKKVVAAIKKDLQATLNINNGISIVSDDAKTRTLIALSRALQGALDQATTRMKDEQADLDTVMRGQEFAPFAVPVLPAISAIGELAISFATILRTQYGFGTVSELVLGEAVLKPKVQAELLKEKNVKLIESDAIVPIQRPGQAERPELAKLKALQGALADLRKKVREANTKAQEIRRDAPKPKDEKDKDSIDRRAAALKSADSIEARAKQATGAADEADKMLATFYVADAQGNTPLDSALRGGILYDRLASSGEAFVLTVKVVSSDVDTIAADGLFKGLRIWVSSNTVATWRLTSLDGVVASVGAESDSSPVRKIHPPKDP